MIFSDIHAAPNFVTFCALICVSEEYRVLPESPPTVDHWLAANSGAAANIKANANGSAIILFIRIPLDLGPSRNGALRGPMDYSASLTQLSAVFSKFARSEEEIADERMY